jgi:2'-5' RNA ligase
MSKQLSLFEMPQSHLPRWSLVLALFPDPDTGRQLGHLGESLCEMYELYGRMRPLNHLHVSLPLPQLPTNSPKIAIEIISRVCQAVATVTCPFEIKFDRVMRFGRGDGNLPVVLAGDDHGNDGVRSLHRSLRAEFAKYISINSSAPRFVPHLTLLYDKKHFDPGGIKPVFWTVREIVLVASEVGATKYHLLGRWEFGG